MSIHLHVTGTVRYGARAIYWEAVRRFVEYRRQKGYCVPRILVGLSGGMNTTLMVFDYDSAELWEREEAAVNLDAEYGRIASEMPYLEGSIHYALFQAMELAPTNQV